MQKIVPEARRSGVNRAQQLSASHSALLGVARQTCVDCVSAKVKNQRLRLLICGLPGYKSNLRYYYIRYCYIGYYYIRYYIRYYLY